MCLFLEISPEEAAKRGGYGDERYEEHGLQTRVRSLFNKLIESSDGEDFVRIDAGRSLEEVQASIRDAVRSAMTVVDGEERPLRFVKPW